MRQPPSLLVDSSILDTTTYATLRRLMAQTFSRPVADTIFIRYTFGGDKCWSSWDNVADSGVVKIIQTGNRHMDSLLQSRPQVSAFNLREPNNDITKWILLNDQVKIDSSSWFFNNIIKIKSACGTSVAIFPNRSMTRLLTDPHYELLYAEVEDWKRLKGARGLKSSKRSRGPRL